jgi:Septum formation initiator
MGSTYTDDVAKETRKKPSKRRSLVVSLQASGFMATVLALIVTAVLVLSPSLRVLAEQRQQIAELEAQLAATDEEVLALEDQLARWQDRAFVETQARSRLMFVYPGDITYLVLDDLPDTTAEVNDEVSDQVEVTHANWREALLASYLVAATTQAEAAVAEPESIPGAPSVPGSGTSP